MSEIAIKVESLSKLYRIGLKESKPETFMSAVMSAISAPFTNYRKLKSVGKVEGEAEDTIWALKDVSFEVKQGEVLGIIGKNGAGKSTLLKILSRITDPSSGKITINGRVASLLEVGTGFHPDLTGRENVYLNGTILGMTRKEVESKYDEIVEFSGIGKFMDTPIKRYSSGMKVRLAFAVAAHLEPEILIIDEVLAVGDMEFQKKCLGKMDEVAKGGRTVLFVSHHMAAVKSLCTRCIFLKDSTVNYDGLVSEAIDRYLTNNSDVSLTGIIPDDFARTFGTGEAKFRKVTLFNRKGESENRFYYKEAIKATVEIEFFKPLDDVVLSFFVGTYDGEKIVFMEYPDTNGKYLQFDKGTHQFTVEVPVSLLPGSYSIYLGAARQKGKSIDFVERVYDFHIIKESVEKDKHYRWDDSLAFVTGESKWEIQSLEKNSSKWILEEKNS